jgi:drug/metabolite transporter (DMT)-like permease
MTEVLLPSARVTREPGHPRVGYAMLVASASFFAVNGAVMKVILTTDAMSNLRLTQLRATGAFVCLAVVLVAFAPARLRITRGELALLLFYGVVGFAMVQWLYLVAIERLPIGIGLLLEFTAPVLVALWARLVWHEPVRRRMWIALTLAMGGVVLVAEVWADARLDGLGFAAALFASGALATYYLVGEHATATRDPLSLACIALGVSSGFWAVLQPWWSFPFDALGRVISLDGALESWSAPIWALCVWMVVAGTIVPFALSLGALRYLPVTRVAVISMLEIVVASLAAWVWLDEALSAAQLLGGAVILAGIVLAQTSR